MTVFLIVSISLIILVFCLSLVFLSQGAQYVPTNDKDAEQIVKLALSYSAKQVLDMGSGDGKLVILLAQAGLQATGIEINPLLVWRSRQAIRKAGIQEKATIIRGSFWSYDVSSYDLIVLFAISHIMPRLERKFQTELKAGTHIISNSFLLPTLKPLKKLKGLTIYQK